MSSATEEGRSSTLDLALTRSVCDALCMDMGAPLRVCINGKWKARSRWVTVEDYALHWEHEWIIGHTTKDNVPVFSRDIDTHGMHPEIAEEVQWEKHFALYRAHGRPSLTVRTREGGGLHEYWWVDRRLAFSLVKNRLLEMVPDVEVLPTPRRNGGAGQVIRTPGAKGGCLLDPDTLEPLPINQNDPREIKLAIIDASHDRVPVEQFLALSPGVASVILGGQVGPRKVKRGLALVGDLDSASKSLRPGETNDPILAMARACVRNGLGVGDAFVFIRERLAASGVPLKEDTQGQGLERRVRRLYATNRNNLRASVHKVLKPTWDTFSTSPVAEGMVDRVLEYFGRDAITGRRLGTLRMVALSLVRSSQRVLSLPERDLFLCNVIYPGFRSRVKRGLVPLPETLWRAWAQRYWWYRQALMVVGVVSPGWDTSKGAHAGYCPGGWGRFQDRHGTCRWYQVQLDPDFYRVKGA